jgi:hypothetical protein
MPDDSRETLQFDVERYVRLSKKVDISDLDLSQAARYPISDEEIRALIYMTDIESHTIVYLRAILNTCAVEDRSDHRRGRCIPGALRKTALP